MKKIKFYLGCNGIDHEEIFEYSDDVTEEEIDGDYEDWKDNFLDCNWWEVDNE